MSAVDYFNHIKYDDEPDELGTFLNSLDIVPHSFGYQNGYNILENYRITGDFELIFFVNGVGIITVEDVRYICKKGDFIIIPPFTKHDIKTERENPHENYWIHFDIRPFSSLQELLNLIIVNHEYKFSCKDIEHFLLLYKQLHVEMSRKEVAFKSIFKATLLQLLSYIIRQNQTDHLTHVVKIEPSIHHYVNLAITYIKANIHRNVSVDEISHHLQISSPYLFKCFKSTVGIAPGKYIQLIRLKEAECMLLTTTLPISKIADIMAYSSPYYLSSLFKKNYGRSPSHYKKLLSEG